MTDNNTVKSIKFYLHIRLYVVIDHLPLRSKLIFISEYNCYYHYYNGNDTDD